MGRMHLALSLLLVLAFNLQYGLGQLQSFPDSQLPSSAHLPVLSRHRRFNNLAVRHAWRVNFTPRQIIPIDVCFDPYNFHNKSGTVTTCTRSRQRIIINWPRLQYMVERGIVRVTRDFQAFTQGQLPFEIPGSYFAAMTLPFDYITGAWKRPLETRTDNDEAESVFSLTDIFGDILFFSNKDEKDQTWRDEYFTDFNNYNENMYEGNNHILQQHRFKRSPNSSVSISPSILQREINRIKLINGLQKSLGGLLEHWRDQMILLQKSPDEPDLYPCLLRLLCEIAMTPDSLSLHEELMKLLLIPEEIIDYLPETFQKLDFVAVQRMGMIEQNCSLLYDDCPLSYFEHYFVDEEKDFLCNAH